MLSIITLPTRWKRQSLMLGTGIALLIIICGYVLNPVWFHFYQNGFRFQFGYSFSAFMELVGSWLMMGTCFGILHAFRFPMRTRPLLQSVGMGMGVYLVLMNMFEVLWYRPWALQKYIDPITHEQHAYNAYQLDALYGSPFVMIIFALASLVVYVVTIAIIMILRQWILPKVRRW